MKKFMHTVTKKIRLLPCMIAVASVAFVLHVQKVVVDVRLFSTPAIAKEEPPHAAAGDKAAPAHVAATNDPEIAAEKHSEKPAAQHAESALPDALKAPPPLETAKKDSYDVTEFSESELGLLQSLRTRREELAKKEEAFQQKERVLEGMEQRLQMKVNELNEIKTALETIKSEIDARAKKFVKNEDTQLMELVRVYEKMKPKDAAKIFNNLDLTILLDVVKGMQESKLALVLASMDAKKATDITTALGKREELPTITATDTIETPQTN